MGDRAILFLHGIPDTGRAWQGVIAKLFRRFRCVAPDLPGFGASPSPERLADLDDGRTLIAAMVARLSLPRRFSLVVHDVGGVLGLAWAAHCPERIERLVILNGSIFPDRRWHWGARLLRVPLVGEAAMALLPKRAFRAEMRRAARGNLPRAAIDETWRAFGPEARRTALRLYRLQAPPFFRGLPEAVRALTAEVPALVIWGAGDPYLPAAFAERFGARDIRLHPDLGHWPHREAPGRVAAEIHAFLTAVPPGFSAE